MWATATSGFSVGKLCFFRINWPAILVVVDASSTYSTVQMIQLGIVPVQTIMSCLAEHVDGCLRVVLFANNDVLAHFFGAYAGWTWNEKLWKRLSLGF
jgi:hypothetical protein